MILEVYQLLTYFALHTEIEILSKFNMLSSKILASSSKSEIKKLEEALSVIKSKMR